MDIKKVGVVGCGIMGHGIAQVSAQAGYEVTVRDLTQEKLDSGLGKLGLKYTAQEFMPKDRVLGESLDNGLGQLGPSYTAWEFMPEGRILGESLDSGLGSLSREDLEMYIRTPAMQRTALDSK